MAAVLALLAGPAWAQEVDCSRAVTQLDMNLCARLDWEAADAELNLAYEAALETAAEADASFPNDVEAALRAAQRAWLPYRDAACEAEAALWGGGSAEPMIRSGCLAMVTRQRAEELWTFAGG
jgi:uncharacterized protein YecT (DUF1311 family)